MNVLRELFQSKKAVAAVVSALAMLLAFVGLPDEVARQISILIAALASAYLLGQGLADFGKHAEAIKAATSVDEKLPSNPQPPAD